MDSMKVTHHIHFRSRFCLFLMILSTLLSCQVDGNRKIRLISYVDPFIGTDGKGKTYPGATTPHGMVQLSPDNGRNGWDWISGYYYPDTVIAGFSHTHLTGTGAGDLYDISFMPVAGSRKEKRLDSVNTQTTLYSRFSHQNEEASPGYYQVFLEDYDVNVELTATTRTGLQRYTFQKNEASEVILNLGYTRNWDQVTSSYLRVVNDSTIVGYRKSSGWARDQQIFFYAIFSKPLLSYQLFSDYETDGQEVNGTNIRGEFDFADAREIMVKTGISSVSIDNARINLDEEQRGFDFEGIRKETELSWENELGKIEIVASEDNMIQFYTAMYHSMLAPVIYSDVNHQYRGVDGQVHQTLNKKYSIFSLWDTFRALHPLTTIIHQEKVPDMINSMLEHYDEYGKLPVWEMLGNETDMMLGYHAVPVIADAYKKGIEGFNINIAYEAMKISAMQNDFQIDAYRELGYVPYEKASWNVSLTMEYAYDDWCIAQVAKELGKTDDYEYFMERALSYRNHYDPGTNFMRAKDSLGQFKSPFDPLAYHPEDYAEANAWQYHWFAPQDIEGMIAFTGGENRFEMKLDSLFEVTQKEGEQPVWISGNIGQYVHGNEPSHHVPYLYQFVEAPSKTQKRVREIMSTLYKTTPDGLCGNEDCGQMSAWYIFSALGFYPVNPADSKYVLGSPEVSEAVITLPDNKILSILALNQSEENVYVQSVSFNGEPLGRIFITHEELMNGGELVFEMGPSPSENE